MGFILEEESGVELAVVIVVEVVVVVIEDEFRRIGEGARGEGASGEK